MTAAFVLGINLFLTAIFAVAFGVIAATNRMAHGAAWLALGYAMGVIDVALEFLLPGQTDATPIRVGIFLIFLLGLSFWLIGVARHYRVVPPRIGLVVIWTWAILTLPIIFSMPFDLPLRGALYQLPYFAMQTLAGLVILRSGRRQPLDLLLVGLQFVAALLYIVKPLIGIAVGMAAVPQGYMATTYAAISQSLGAVTLVALGMVLLLVMMRDTTAEMIAKSETDPLSGVLNRRGFEQQGQRALAATGAGGVLIAADLDHFKQINDNHGHGAGDGVIAHFAALLRDTAPGAAIVGRVGGEEFAVFLIGATLGDGRRYAETVRARFAGQKVPGLAIDHCFTASFGVAQLVPGDTLTDILNRADAALYRAKAGGRNRVCAALGELPLSAVDAA